MQLDHRASPKALAAAIAASASARKWQNRGPRVI